MTTGDARAPAEPFFLPREGGQRFCLYHPAAGACRGAVLYVHPFAEEMNRSRRMAALQARALAAHGVAVLQIDLLGCGDSSGESADMRWSAWKADLAAAHTWLAERTGQPAVLLGLRLGALLAADYARSAAAPLAGLALWQPVHAGSAYINQFLRLRLASDMLAGGDGATGTASLRTALASGEVLEVAGYELHPDLVRELDQIALAELKVAGLPLHWMEVAATAGRPLPPVAARIIETLGAQVHQVEGPQFWATQEITECPALIEATLHAVRKMADAS
jgi:exosortase A-associated hydrolase 2